MIGKLIAFIFGVICGTAFGITIGPWVLEQALSKLYSLI